MDIKTIIDKAFNQNTYILTIDNKLVIIDPGYNFNQIVDELKDKKPDLILLTHYHFDHVASVNKLCEKFNIKAYIEQNDYHNLIANNGATFFGFAPVDVSQTNVEIFYGEIDLLPSLKIIHAPGHSEGSTIFQVENNLFTGDVIFANGHGRVDLIGGNEKDMKHTLKRLNALSPELIIYPGHGEKSKLGIAMQYIL